MNFKHFFKKLDDTPEMIDFQEVMTLIDSQYDFTETAFTNGQQKNASGENSGSCKIFSFATLHLLNQAQTLALFGEFYRNDVLQNPNGDDHQNIRQFMQHGFAGLTFERNALTAKY